MSRALVCHLCSWALAGAAWAGDPAAALDGQTRVEVALSVANRSSFQNDSGLKLSYAGRFSPGHLRLAAAHFFHPAFGVTANLGLDVFGLTGRTFTDTDETKLRTVLTAPDVAAAAVGRFRILEALAVEGHAGYAYQLLPTIITTGSGDVNGAYATLHGPAVAAQVRWDAFGPLSVQAGARFTYGLGVSAPSGPLPGASAWQVLGEASVTYRLFRLGPAQLAPGASFEYATAAISGGSATSYTLQQSSYRFGLSIRGWLPPAGADLKGLDRPLPSGPGRIHGLVVRDGKAPVPGARVEVPGQDPVVTRADGSFSVEKVPPGPVAMTVTAAGFKSRAESVTVSPGAELQLTVTLEAPTGPGKIRGTAFAAPPQQGGARTPLADVTIQGPRGAVRAAADGTFTLDEVGPGPVQLKATLKGFKPAEEVVSVPPEGEAAVELTLVRETAKVLASMRGQVRNLKGKPVAAVLKVPEAQISTRTGSDGRFNVRVPGGKYTVVFEAPGYVRQTKTVEVADGDQAIFYVDLSREDR